MLACCVQKNYTVIKYKDLEEYTMLSIAICEDNVPVQSQLENYIHELFSSCPVEIFSSGEELLSGLEGKERGFSIYLMDISLPGISGIETAASIRTRDPYALILYITDYREYVYQVFETLPYRFILKPVDKSVFQKALSVRTGIKCFSSTLTGRNIRSRCRKSYILSHICAASHSIPRKNPIHSMGGFRI